MRNVYAAVLMVFGLVAVLPAQANEDGVTEKKSVHQHQFLSKRPYQAPVVVANKSGADQAWEGASMIEGQDRKEKHLQVLKMHSIGKRPL